MWVHSNLSHLNYDHGNGTAVDLVWNESDVTGILTSVNHFVYAIVIGTPPFGLQVIILNQHGESCFFCP